MFYLTDRDLRWIERAVAAVNRAFELDSRLPEAFVARARIAYAQEDFEQAADYARMAIARRSDCESSWDLLGRALFASKRWQEAADLVERAIRATGDDYNVYVPYGNALHALGRTEAAGALHRRHAEVLERQLELVPEDTRAGMLLAGAYAALGRSKDAVRQLERVLAMNVIAHDLQRGLHVRGAEAEGGSPGRAEEGHRGRLRRMGTGNSRSRPELYPRRP